MISDDEDNQSLIDEIQALENVLDQQDTCVVDDNSKLNISLKLESKLNDDYDENDDVMDVEEERNEELIDNDYNKYNCNDLENLLELNKKLIESISAARDKMLLLLHECIKNQRKVEELINKQSSSWHTKIITFNAGMPYFKDKNYFTPKPNEDTETKIKNGELRLTQLQRIHRWNQQDKSNLLKAIKHEVTETVLKGNESENTSIDKSITKTSQLPSEVKKAIGSLGSMKFDWLKIANRMPENKHSAEECEVMWNVFLHPDINKQKWTSKEDKDLNRIVEEYGFEDWDSIAKDLNTKRSGYQCFVRYNTNNWKNLMKGQSWTSQDDDYLVFLVGKLKIGDYIPWGYIASCMSKWTKQQVYFRWMYSLAPHLKKGKFSAEEDKTLLEAVEKYGTNFSKISALVMNQRTNIQLKEHYKTLMAKNSQVKKIWKIEEDTQLIKLHEKYGSNWAKIVKEMNNVTRVQARQRYASLIRLEQKGISLEHISRKESNEISDAPCTVVTYTSNTPWSRENKEIHVKYLKIDEQLINFFKRDNLARKSEQINKSYLPDKLKHDTKKLYKILLELNANLNVPDYIDEYFELSEMNQQLLTSLQKYKEEKKKNLSENIERVRLRMFGPQEVLPEKQRFIPPLPFGFCAPKPKKKSSNKIDATVDVNEFNQLTLKMVLEPNQYVTEYLGEDVENEFEKLKKVVTTESTQKMVYKLRCKPFANSIFFKEEDIDIEHNAILDQPTISTGMKYDWELNRMVSGNVIEDKVIVESVPISIIEPVRTTLQAYQEILLVSSSFPSESSEINTYNKLTLRGREALNLFKRRYQQLFHVPTGLSRIIPPDVVDESAFLPILEKLQKKNSKNKRQKKLQKVSILR